MNNNANTNSSGSDSISSGLCPVTGLPVREFKAFTNIQISSTYSVTFKLIGDRILLSIPRGSSDKGSLETFLHWRQAFLKKIKLENVPYAEIKDYNMVLQTAKGARDVFTSHMREEDEKGYLRAYLGYNTSPVIKWIMNIGARLIPRHMAFVVVKDYRTAVTLADQVLNGENDVVAEDTNRKIRKKEWTDDSGNTKVCFDIIGSSIVYSKITGPVKSEFLSSYFNHFTKILNESGFSTIKGYYFIADWSDIKLPSWFLRRKYLEYIKKLNKKVPCVYTVIISDNIKFWNLVLVINNLFIPFPVNVVKTYRQAICLIESRQMKAMQFIYNQNKIEPKTRIAKEVEKVLEYIGSINWNETGTEVPPKLNKYQIEDFQPIYEALALIKQDFDGILNEKNETEKAIAEKNRFNKIRAEIWKIASDRTLSQFELIQRLLNLAGPAFGVSRACYNEYVDKRGVSKDLICVVEWCDKNVSPSLKTKIPNFLVRIFENIDSFHFNLDEAARLAPKNVRSLVKSMIRGIFIPLNMKSVAILPYKVGNIIEGWFTFDICRNNKNNPVMDDNIRGVVHEMVDIVANHNAQKKADQELEKTYNELEDRVKERTFELAEANRKLKAEIKERQRAEDFKEALYNISRAAFQSDSVKDLFMRVHQILREVMFAGNFYAAVFNKPADEFQLIYSVDVKGESLKFDKDKKGITEYVFYTARPFTYDRKRSEQYSKMNEYNFDSHNANIWMAVPLKTEFETLGVMGIYHYCDSPAHTERELQMLEFISAEVSGALSRKSAQENLIVSERKYRSLFNQIGDPIFIFHQKTYRFLDFNDAVFRIYGYTREELMKMTPLDLHSKAEKDIVRKRIDNSNLDEPHSCTHVTRSGDFIEVEIISDRIMYQSQPAWISVHRDITERKKAEEKLRRAMELAEAANIAKSQFLANISHEIRTPLNAVIGFSEIILRSSNIKNIHEQAGIILRESNSLLSLINMLLDHAKIEAGKLELDFRSFDLRLMLKNIYEGFSSQISKKGLSFKMNIADDVPDYIKSDDLRLRQILVNLIGNAVKFTDQGEIKLKIWKETDECEKIFFAVIDTGIGIPKEKQETIFSSFTQADGSTTRQYGGTGLGTTIARQLIELLEGRISVESKPQKGSKFWFYIPLISGQAQQKDKIQSEIISDHDPEIAEKCRKINILVAEDYPANQEVVRIGLEDAGFNVDIAVNGEEAVKACRNKSYQLIFMDVQMPVMDGYEATGRIRKLNHVYERIPVIGLTAHTQAGEQQNCIKSGMNDVIFKPLHQDLLVRTVLKWLNMKLDIQADKRISKNNSSDPIDFQTALEEFGNENVLKNVISQFIKTVEGQLTNMQNSIEEKDYESVRSEAHAIKGGALTLEAGHLASMAANLENCIKQQQFDQAQYLLNYLEKEFDVIKEYSKRVLNIK